MKLVRLRSHLSCNFFKGAGADLGFPRLGAQTPKRGYQRIKMLSSRSATVGAEVYEHPPIPVDPLLVFDKMFDSLKTKQNSQKINFTLTQRVFLFSA